MEIAPVPGIRTLTPASERVAAPELHAPQSVEAVGRIEDDSYSGGGQSGDRGMEENLKRNQEQSLERSQAGMARGSVKPRAGRGGTTAYGVAAHTIDFFV